MAEQPKLTEERVQIAIVEYVKMQYPNALLTATMGGQYQRHYSQRLKARRTGYLRGVSDLLIFEPNENVQRLVYRAKEGQEVLSLQRNRKLVYTERFK